MIENLSIVTIIRVTVLLVALAYASILDYKTRIVPDKIWYAPVAIGFLIIGYEMYIGDPTIVALNVSISFFSVFLLSYLMLKLQIFYEADHKALSFIAILVPINPNIGILPLYELPNEITIYSITDIIGSGLTYIEIFNYLLSHIFINVFGFTVFINASLLGFLFFVTNISHNVKTDNFNIKKPLRTISARKVNLEKVTNQKAIIVDKVESDGFVERGIEYIKNGLYGLSTMFYTEYIKWYREQSRNDPDSDITDINKLQLSKFIEDSEDWVSDDIESDKKQAEKYLKEDEVWITLSTPFIVVITLSCLVSIIFGNIGYLIMTLLL